MSGELKKLMALLDRRDKLYFGGLLGLMGIGSLLDVLGVGAVPAFVAALAIPERVMRYPVLKSVFEMLDITTGRQLIIWGSVALIVIFFLKNAFLVLMYYAQVSTLESFRIRLSHRLFSAYMEAPYEFHLQRNTSELLRNVNFETREIVHGILSPLMTTVLAFMMTVLIVILLMVTTPGVALLGVGMVGAGSWLFVRLFKNKLHHFGEEAQQERQVSMQAVNEGLGSLLDARVLGREAYFISSYYHSIERFLKASRIKQFVNKISTPVLEFIAVAGLLLIVLVMVLLQSDLARLVPMIALFGVAIIRLRATISQMVNGATQMRYSIVAIDPVVNDLKLLRGAVQGEFVVPSPPVPPEGKLHLRQAIAVEGVTYSYPNTEAPSLRDVTLTIEKGTSIAFVGSTGSGKTTLINVLLGLLKPQQGQITVDGVDIHSNLREWHPNVGYIPQTIYLLDDTIRRNIAFGFPDEEIDDEKLWTAIRAAQLEDFVNSLSAGLHTLVGERGVRISGGQRQRIGLARALYHNPEVLIMDEATSSLDNHTENLVMRALEELKEGRTFIMIAHRLSTVRNCDRLYFMKDGRIEAEGTYDELSALHTEFRRMAEVV